MEPILSYTILFAIWLGVFKITVFLADPSNPAAGPAALIITTIFSLGIWAFFLAYGLALLEAIIWTICKIWKVIIRLVEKIQKIASPHRYLTWEEKRGGYLDFRFQNKGIKEGGSGE